MRRILFGALGLVAGWAGAQTPELRAIASRPDIWPHDVLTKAAVAAPAKNLPPIAAGTPVKVVGLEGPLIDVDCAGTLLVLPIAQTDFLERATANLAKAPTPPVRQAPAAAAAEPAVQPVPASPGHRDNPLGAKLVPSLLVFDPASKVDHLISGGEQTAHRGFLVLQFGGGRRWADAMNELRQAVQVARDRGADFETVLVPLQGATVQSTIALYRESGFAGPIVDPRQSDVVNDLWARFGHSGTFALALVGPKGDLLVRTVPQEKSVDKFHAVLAGLAMVPKA